MGHLINRPVLHLGARRICPKKFATVPIRRRSDRSRNKPATAIGADIFQNVFDAGHAEGALIGADARLKRVGRQRPVAVLTGWLELKHGIFDMKLSLLGNQWYLEHFSIR